MNGGTVLQAQLHALRAHLAALDAFVAMLLVTPPPPTEPEARECSHAETRDISTMGMPARICVAPGCHTILTGAAAGGVSP